MGENAFFVCGWQKIEITAGDDPAISHVGRTEEQELNMWLPRWFSILVCLTTFPCVFPFLILIQSKAIRLLYSKLTLIPSCTQKKANPANPTGHIKGLKLFEAF